MAKLIQALTVGAALAQACPVAVPPPLPQAITRPPQAQCAAVRDVDLRALEREAADARREAERQGGQGPGQAARIDAMLEPVVVSSWAGRRPPADAPVIIRARLAPGGGHSSDHRAVVWREADGGWWFWRHSVNAGAPKPPPLPPRGIDPGSAEGRAWSEAQVAGRTVEERYWPPVEGRLSASRAAQMEAAWSDPCRGWDPDFWPRDIPLNRRIDGSRRRVCAQDSSAIVADIAEAGRERRPVGGACNSSSPTYRMIEIAAYATAD